MPDSTADAYALFVGIDLGAKTARVRWIVPGMPPAPGLTIDQSAEGWEKLYQRLLGLHIPSARVHVSMEATGSYYIHLAHFLHEHGFAVSVINALRVRRYAEVHLQLDKTDDLDALVLARFGAALHPPLWMPPPPIYEELFQRIVQRQSLMRLRAQLANRRYALDYRIIQVPSVKARQKELALLLRRQMDKIEREIRKVLAMDPAWQANALRITTIPGVGLVTAAWLVMLTHNFTTCRSAAELTAFIGLVPRRRQSGESLNTHRSIGHVGHDDIRHHLYNVAQICLYYNSVIRAFYDQVKARRGKHKLACVAATRKLVHLIWAVATKGQPFDPDYALKKGKLASDTSAPAASGEKTS